MATTSLTLGGHWEQFIKTEVASGRYASASEVIRDALRVLEIRRTKLQALRAYLAEGAEQAENRHFIEGFSMDALIREMDDLSEKNLSDNTARS